MRFDSEAAITCSIKVNSVWRVVFGGIYSSLKTFISEVVMIRKRTLHMIAAAQILNLRPI